MPIRHSIFLSFFIFISLIGTGQMKRVVAPTGNGTRQCSHQQSVEVYEYDCVDIQPRFPGGNQELLRFINETRRYPSEAYRHGVQGRVVCGFVVNEDGSISHISLVKGVEESLNNEALRIISEMPKWESGRLNSRNVSVYCVLPIVFRL